LRSGVDDDDVTGSALANAKTPDNLVYEAKSALSVIDCQVAVMPTEMNSFRVDGPTADERRVNKEYVLRAESVQEMAEWMQVRVSPYA
jgi:hypothetical protein